MSCKSRRRKQLDRWRRRYEKAMGWKNWKLEEVFERLRKLGCHCAEGDRPIITLPDGQKVKLLPGLSVMTIETIGRPRERALLHTCNGCGLSVGEDEAAHTCGKCRKLIDTGHKCETCRGAHLSLVP